MSPRVRTVDGVALDVVESCLYLWLFDPKAKQYRRVPRGTRIEYLNTSEGWEPYFSYDIHVEAGTFLVLLNEEGTRRQSATWHAEDCECLNGPVLSRT
jgi:hypothetical protein